MPEVRVLTAVPRSPLRASLLAVFALLALCGAVRPQGAPRKPLSLATGKLIAKQEKLIGKSQAAIAKLEDKIAFKEGVIAQAEIDQAESQETADFIGTLLVVAEEDLEDALALPEGTEEEIAFKKEAVKVAKLGVKLAVKEQNIYLKQVAKYQKTIDGSNNVIAKSEASIDAHEAKIAAAEAEIARLETPFDYDARQDVPALIRLVDGQGTPMENIQVLVVAEMLPPKGGGSKRIELRTSGTVYARGRTDGDGELALTLHLPDDLEAVDIVALAADRAGPYTHEVLRERWGAFAPASRLTVALDDLADVQLALPLED